MKLATLRLWWREFNDQHYAGILAPCPIRITRSRRYYGYCTDTPAIYLGRHHCVTDVQFRDTLLHEMIHQYLLQIGRPDWDEHTSVFQDEHLRLFGREYIEEGPR